MDYIYSLNPWNGLYPEHLFSTGVRTASRVTEHLTIGGGVDSGIEYLLKQYLMNGDEKALDQCTFSPFHLHDCVRVNAETLTQISSRRKESSQSSSTSPQPETSSTSQIYTAPNLLTTKTISLVSFPAF